MAVSGSTYSWGLNHDHVLGYNLELDSTEQVEPRKLPLFSNVTAVAAGEAHSLALTGTLSPRMDFSYARRKVKGSRGHNIPDSSS